MIDLLIVGGGPAGLVTALHARRAGLRTVVLERRAAPIDKACGEGLMPPALAALTRLGVDVAGRPIRGIRYCSPTANAVADFRSGAGRGVRRTELHSALDAAVRAAGVEIVAGGAVRAIGHGPESVTLDGRTARYLVGADGLHSAVRRSVGLEPRRASRHAPRWGVRAHFACPPWSDRVEVHWSPTSEAYVTPVGDDCVGVAVLSSERGSFADRLAAFPALRERLPAEPLERPRAAGPLRQDVRSRVAGRVLLVGDAAGYVDALTGEGLAISFHCAEALVARVRAGTPARYEHDYRTLTRRYRLLTESLLAVARQPSFRRQVVPLAARAPRIFAAAVNQLAR